MNALLPSGNFLHMENGPIIDELPTMATWWVSHPSEKYESQLGVLFPVDRKNKIHVPNHQANIY